MSEPAIFPPPRRKPRIVVPIAAAIVLFMLTTAILYYRWATMTEPSCVLVVQTSPALRDAIVKVDGPSLISGALKATVGASGRYTIPFYLDPGEYTVDIILNDEPQYHGKVMLLRNHMSTLPLTDLRPSTTGTTLPSPSPF